MPATAISCKSLQVIAVSAPLTGSLAAFHFRFHGRQPVSANPPPNTSLASPCFANPLTFPKQGRPSPYSSYLSPSTCHHACYFCRIKIFSQYQPWKSAPQSLIAASVPRTGSLVCSATLHIRQPVTALPFSNTNLSSKKCPLNNNQ